MTPEEVELVRSIRARVRADPWWNPNRFDLLAERDGARCFYCFVGLTEEDHTIDHVIPRAKGGTRELSNVRLACDRCNCAKGDDDPELWTRGCRVDVRRRPRKVRVAQPPPPPPPKRKSKRPPTPHRPECACASCDRGPTAFELALRAAGVAPETIDGMLPES